MEELEVLQLSVHRALLSSRAQSGPCTLLHAPQVSWTAVFYLSPFLNQQAPLLAAFVFFPVELNRHMLFIPLMEFSGSQTVIWG